MNNWSKKNEIIIFFLGFLLSGIILTLCFIHLKIWPFGDQTLLVVDSVHQYLSFFMELKEKLSQGDSLLYSFSGGLGFDFWGTVAYYLASPFNIFLVFVPESHVADFMDFLIWFKTATAGGLFAWYLSKRHRSYFSIVFGSAFALSNFLIAYDYNIMWLDSIAVLPLIMYGTEQVVKKGKCKVFLFSLAYSLWCNYYISFMICIFCCMYFIICWVAESPLSWKQTLHRIRCFTLSAVTAACLAAVILLPAFMGLTQTQSLGDAPKITDVEWYLSIKDVITNHLFLSDPVTVSSSQDALNVYCGIFIILLAFIYLFTKKIRLRERIAYFSMAAFLLVSFSLNWLNFIWHGFHVQNGLPNRFAFLYIALLIVMAYDALICSGSRGRIAASVGMLIPFGLCAYLVISGSSENNIFLTMLLIVLYFAFLSGYRKRIVSIFLALLMIAEVSVNALVVFEERGTTGRDFYVGVRETYQDLVPDDSGFFRSEIDYQQMRNFSMYAGGNSIVLFNSTMKETITDFMGSLGLEARMNKTGYSGATKLVNDILGIRYLLTPNSEASTLNGFHCVGEKDGSSLFENDQALSVGYMVSDNIKGWDIDDGDPLEVQNQFVELATGISGLYEKVDDLKLKDGNYNIKIPEGMQVILYLQDDAENIILEAPEYHKSMENYTNILYPMDGEGTAKLSVELKGSQEYVNAKLYKCMDDKYEQVIERLAGQQLENVKEIRAGLEGKITVDEAGTLLLSIPFDQSWKITCNGEPVEYFSVGNALTGIHLEKGVYTIQVKYAPASVTLGAAVSFVTAAGLLFASCKKRKK